MTISGDTAILAEGLVKQNNAIDLYEDYFAGSTLGVAVVPGAAVHGGAGAGGPA